jgi:hypothetical protein
MQLCWICHTRPADSGEHRFKASDVRSVAPRISQATPVFLQRDSRATNNRVGSAKADRLKFAKSICTECNNALTQPYDVAWGRLSAYLLANWPAIVQRESSTSLCRSRVARAQRRSMCTFLALPRSLLTWPSSLEAKTSNVTLEASAVCEIGALSDLDNISVRIADVAARLAVLGDRLRDELRSPTLP